MAARWRALPALALTAALTGALTAGCVTIAQTSPVATAPGSNASVPSAAARSPGAATAGAPTASASTAAATPAAATPVSEVSVVVIIDSGPDAGTHTAVGDPSCGYRQVTADGWSAQYGNLAAGPGDLSTVQLTDDADSTGNEDARIVSVYVTVGPIFGGRSYTLSLDRFTSGTFTHEITDNGTSAVIHVAGQTIESPLGPGGVGVDLTLNCPTVARA